MLTLTRESASVMINASLATVYDPVSDVEQMARFSSELDAVRWLDGAVGHSRRDQGGRGGARE